MLVTEVSEETLKNHESNLAHCRLCCSNPKRNTLITFGRDTAGHEVGTMD